MVMSRFHSLSSLVIVTAISIFLPASVLPERSDASTVEQCSYQVVNTYPHDPTAFTQGLVYFDPYLYEGTGLYGGSSIRKVELETGKVLQRANLARQFFGEGVTIWQDQLIQLTWRSQRGFVYDLQSFERQDQFTYPTEGWGLTHDGDRLIMSDGSHRITFLDPDTFEILSILPVYEGEEPVPNLNELEYIKGEIYANVWYQDRIARISPKTGQILGWIDLTGLYDPALRPNQDAVLNGIAYDRNQDRLFVTGKLWSRLFEIKIDC